MSVDAHAELLNVYDAEGRAIGVLRRAQAKASGLAVGAVNALLCNSHGEVLLQQRLPGKENGGLWDKSVGGHVAAGEDFDVTAVRETGEELFTRADSACVHLASTDTDFEQLRGSLDLDDAVLLKRMDLHLNVRDVRHVPGGGVLNVLYHVATYGGLTDVPLEGFRPQAAELAALRYVSPAEVDRLLLAGQLAPNMAFLWLRHGHDVLAGQGVGPELESSVDRDLVG